MIRKFLTVTALLLVAACSKAPEDATARYSIAGGSVVVTAKATAKGDLRLDTGPQTLIRKDGKDYVVINENGEKFALSVADFIAAQDEFMKASGSKPQPRTNDPEYEAVDVGEETVAGLKGAIWRVQPKGKAAVGESLQLVISNDPSLANLGKAVQLQGSLRAAGMKQLTGSESSVEKNVNDVMGKGMLLRMGDVMMLQDVTKGAIPATEFALPKVLDKATILKRMSEARDKAMEAAKAQGGATPPAGAPVPAPAPAPSPTATK